MKALLTRLRDRMLGITKISSQVKNIEGLVRNARSAQKTSAAQLRKDMQKLRADQAASELRLRNEIRALQRMLVSQSVTAYGSGSTRWADRARSSLHEQSRIMWQQSERTFDPADPNGFYKLSDTVLRERFLPKVGHVARALDIGCGNGTFTFAFGDVADAVTAFDISPSLIDQARREAKHRHIQNISFSVGDLESDLPPGPFGLVGCMGVLVTVIEDEPFVELIEQLSKAIVPGGFLLTKDSTAKSGNGDIKDTKGSIRNYRSVTFYEDTFRNNGFRMLEKVEMMAWKNYVNHFYLWVKEEPRLPEPREIGEFIPWDHGNDRHYSCWSEELRLQLCKDGPYTIVEAKNPKYQKYVGCDITVDDRATSRVLRDILRFVDELFTKHGITYWLNNGALLGCMRHDDIIPWDNDCDVMIENSDVEKIAALQGEIAAAGYVYAEKVKYGRNYKMYIRSATMPKINVELTNLYPHEVDHPRHGRVKIWKYHPIMQEVVLKRIMAMAKRDPNDIIAAHRIAQRQADDILFDNQYLDHEIYPLKRRTFADFSLNTPNKARTILTRDYGEQGFLYGTLGCSCQWTEGDFFFKVRINNRSRNMVESNAE
jgi:phosphorylcholine metabolism protein LicD/SAM-dependent methyltransferase